jgi:hypothetical protein
MICGGPFGRGEASSVRQFVWSEPILPDASPDLIETFGILRRSVFMPKLVRRFAPYEGWRYNTGSRGPHPPEPPRPSR